MSFLRRLLGGREGEGQDHPTPAARSTPDEIAESEREHERELARAEAERLDDLRQRQLRYAQHAWTPPPQGGERRADDEDATGGDG